MDLNALAISCIESDYLKKYLIESNHTFTLEEQITIIFNSNIPLRDKLNMYERYLVPEYIKNYADENIALFKQYVNFIIANAECIQDWLEGTPHTTIMFDSEKQYNIVCCNNIHTFKDILQYNFDTDTLDYITVYICDVTSSNILAWITLNNNLEVIGYSFTDKSRYCGIEDKYLDIPNDIKVGDIVTISNDIDSIKYVVIHDSSVPEHLKEKSEFSIDAAITVVPEYILDRNQDYTEQINQIIKNRISKLENNDTSTDILSEEHDHVHITLVEKIK